MNEYARPLEGIKVIELATFIAGPCCARFLADMGAEVIKVESEHGDPLRYFAANEGRPSGDAEDTTFCLENAGKRCVTLNTKLPEGRRALEKLVAEADILITNWRVAALKRNGLDYETLKEKYPKLVVGHISGYGEKGPDKDLPGFDFTAYYARGGIIGTMYDADASPMIPIAGFGDHQAGLFLSSGVVAALYRAKETGKGDYVSVSLLHSALWDTALALQSSQYGSPSACYPVSRKNSTNPFNTIYKTADGRWIQVAMPDDDRYYAKFMSAFGRTEPMDKIREKRSAVWHIVETEIAGRTAKEVLEAAKMYGLPFALCQNWNEIRHDPQAWESGALTKVTFPNGSERTMVRVPVMLKNTKAVPCERAAYLGEHTRIVLKELGYGSEQIEAMLQAGEAGDLTRLN